MRRDYFISCSGCDAWWITEDNAIYPVHCPECGERINPRLHIPGVVILIEEYDWASGQELGLFECDICGHVRIDWKPLENKVCPQCFTVRYFWSPFPDGVVAVEDER